jgi:glycosyltransferase involved in cell wall biosynthesis
MLLGRPVVATGWSGNLTFMNADVSALVSYRLIPAKDSRGNYTVQGAFWADPDIEDAAAWLQYLGSDAALRQHMGEAGRRQAQIALGSEPLLSALAANGIT